MERLVISIDCDDVLLPSTEKIVDMYNKQYGTDVSLAGSQDPHNPEWRARPEEIGERIYDIQLTSEYAETPPFEDAIEVCRRLSNDHELHMVTARPGRVMPVTIDMLEKYFKGVFTEIEHVGRSGSKGDVCRRLKSDVLIDDNITHLASAKDCGIDNRIWFGNYDWQAGGDTIGASTLRCMYWQEVGVEIERIANR